MASNAAPQGAGYSKRTLVEKLGIKPGMRIAILQAPPDYLTALGILPNRVAMEHALGDGAYDFIQMFSTSAAELSSQFPQLEAALAARGMLWVSWPKRTSKSELRLESTLDENVIRELGLAIGLVDIKVAAIDAVWSGLKFVHRRN